jgi:SpoVK/Ycf46/Vps4 family AAA+-type ATPase
MTRVSHRRTPHTEVDTVAFLLRCREYFERLIDLRMREARRREGGVLTVDDDSEEAALREALARDDAQVKALLEDHPDLPVARLAEGLGLSWDEVRVLLLCAMPAFDTGFRMRIARYKDNILFNFVDVDLACALFFEADAERIAGQRLFTPDAPLLRYRLVRLVHHADLTNDDLINQEVRLPERVVNALAGRSTLAQHLAPFCSLREPQASFEDLFVPEKDKERVRRLLAASDRGLVVLAIGSPGSGRTTLAEAMASHLGQRLLLVDGARWAALHGASPDPERIVDDVVQEALFLDAVLVVSNLAPLLEMKSPLVAGLVAALPRFRGVAVMTVAKSDGLDPLLERAVHLEVRLDRPSLDDRVAMWQRFTRDVPLAEGTDVDAVAHQFDIPGGYIRNAISLALNRAQGRDPDHPRVGLEDLVEGAQAQLRGDLTDLTERSRMTLTMDDLILPDLEMRQVRGLLSACRNHQKVLKDWGFARKLTTGRGIVALFTGEPGTGKTLCAEILANMLAMQLYQVSIPKMVSKWIGETEKNIATVFSKARAMRAMLLFDEADALFTSRVEVKTSTDRYSNLEVNYLLQEIERYDGIVILTTNRDKDFDKAFKRRILFSIQFPFPKPDERVRIWQRLMPREVPQAEELDFAALSRNFELAGGNIKNILLRAAYKAMDAGTGMTMRAMIESAEEESRHAGKVFRRPQDDDF